MGKTRTGKLNTKITFWEYKPNRGPEPGELEKKILYQTRAEIYDPSMKDLEILNGRGTKKALTMVIRDPGRSYVPNNKHYVEILDYRLEGIWNIMDIRADITGNRFLTILLGMTGE